ncbi:MAG: flagellar basal body rod C-terminal domain-containing protein [Pirellulales bacterium]
MASFLQTPLEGQSGLSIANVYDKLVSDVSDGSARTKAAADGFRTFEKTLSGQYLAVTGVSIDEETVRLLTYQRMFQASARVITTINEMLNTLINL